MRINATRSRKLCNGSASGLRRPTPSSIGSTFENNLPNFCSILAIAPLQLWNNPRVAETLYRLEIESLDLGPGIRAVGLELLDPEMREPVTGPEAGRIWAAALVALATGVPWTLDFFAHLERVREFCRLQKLR